LPNDEEHDKPDPGCAHDSGGFGSLMSSLLLRLEQDIVPPHLRDQSPKPERGDIEATCNMWERQLLDGVVKTGMCSPLECVEFKPVSGRDCF